jgi:hypothetical protein
LIMLADCLMITCEGNDVMFSRQNIDQNERIA